MSNVKQTCGPLPPGSAVNLNKLNLIEIELFIKMLHRVWSSFILGDPGAFSGVDKMFMVKVYCKIVVMVKVYCKIVSILQ